MINLTSIKDRRIGFITANHKWFYLASYGFQLGTFALFWHSDFERWWGIEIHRRGKIVWDWTLYEPQYDYECDFCGEKGDCDCEDFLHEDFDEE